MSPDTGSLSIRLPFRPPLAANHLLAWLALRAVEGIATVDGDVVHTALRLHAGAGVASLRFDETWVQCDLELDQVGDLALAVAQCRAMLDLDADPTHIDATLAAIPPLTSLVTALPGLRSPGSADGFATLVFAILGQQRSVAAARTLAGRIAARATAGPDGSPNDGPDGLDAHAEGSGGAPGRRALRPFPGPAAVADLDLDGIGLTRRTAATIVAVAERFDGRTDELSPGADRDSLRRELLSITGIGPWTANYLAMRALGHPDIFLAGDLVAERAASALGLTPELIDDARPWRSYLTHHLWAAAAAPAEPKARP
jgi:AraC family transcriptional regulator of adaptative response / DNA-3-methyladenine glycosylase II